MIVPLAQWHPAMNRKWWGSDARRLWTPLSGRIGWTWHHTAGGTGLDPEDYARGVADWHWDKWSRPGGYNFIVGEDAVAREMCGWDHIGAHAPGGNTKTIGVSFQGDFSGSLPTPAMLATALALMDERPSIPRKQFGHRDWSSTSCPGGALYRALPLRGGTAATGGAEQGEWDVLKRGDTGPQVNYFQRRINDAFEAMGLRDRLKDDGDFGPATEDAVKRVQAHVSFEETGVLDMATAIYTQALAHSKVPHGGTVGLSHDEADRRYVRRGTVVKLP